MGLLTRYNTLGEAATTLAKAELVTFLDSPKFAQSKMLLVGAIREWKPRLRPTISWKETRS